MVEVEDVELDSVRDVDDVEVLSASVDEEVEVEDVEVLSAAVDEDEVEVELVSDEKVVEVEVDDEEVRSSDDVEVVEVDFAIVELVELVEVEVEDDEVDELVEELEGSGIGHHTFPVLMYSSTMARPSDRCSSSNPKYGRAGILRPSDPLPNWCVAPYLILVPIVKLSRLTLLPALPGAIDWRNVAVSCKMDLPGANPRVFPAFFFSVDAAKGGQNSPSGPRCLSKYF